MSRLRLILTALMTLGAWLVLPGLASASSVAAAALSLPSSSAVPLTPTLDEHSLVTAIEGVSLVENTAPTEPLANFRGGESRIQITTRLTAVDHSEGESWRERRSHYEQEGRYHPNSVAVGLPASVLLFGSGLFVLSMLRRSDTRHAARRSAA